MPTSVLAYVLRRAVVYFVPVLIGMSLLVFGVIRLLPGDAVDLLAERMTNEQREITRRVYGLDQPIPVQYVKWLKQVATGNLGTSLRSGRPVTKEIASVMVATIELGVIGVLIGILVGVSVGVISAIRIDSALDRGLRAAVYVGISVPDFWLGTLLIITFAIAFPLLPAGGYVSLLDSPLEGLRYALMPALVLGLIMAGFLSRVVRSTMLEVLRQDYITVARAKGLDNHVIIYRHALRNAAGPIVTLIGLQVAFLISGAIIVEEVFVRPGLGRLLVRAIFQRDYAVVQGITLLFTLIFIVTNLLTDILRGLIDPRVRGE